MKNKKEIREAPFEGEAFLEGIEDAVIIISANKVDYVNEALVKITGYQANELEGEAVTTIIGKVVSKTHMKYIMKRFMLFLVGKENLKDGVTVPISRKDGKTIYIQTSSSYVTYSTGEKKLLTVFKDVTEERAKNKSEFTKKVNGNSIEKEN